MRRMIRWSLESITGQVRQEHVFLWLSWGPCTGWSDGYLRKYHRMIRSSERSTARWFPEITVHRIIRCSLENTHRIIRCSLENHRKIRCSLENHRKIRWCWIAEHRIIRWSQKHTESIANVMFERLTEQTFSKSDEDLIKGVPRHPKDSTKRTPWKIIDWSRNLPKPVWTWSFP